MAERVDQLRSSTEASISSTISLAKLVQSNATCGERLDGLDAEVDKLWAEVQQTGCCRAERRKLAEAEARAAEARIEEQRVKGEQDRLTVKMKREDREEADRVMRKRVELEA